MLLAIADQCPSCEKGVGLSIVAAVLSDVPEDGFGGTGRRARRTGAYVEPAGGSAGPVCRRVSPHR